MLLSSEHEDRALPNNVITRAVSLLPSREKVPEGRMRGHFARICQTWRSKPWHRSTRPNQAQQSGCKPPSSVAARHLLPRGEKEAGALPNAIVKHRILLLPSWEKVPEGRMRGPWGIPHVMSLRPTQSHWRPSHQQPCITPGVESPLIRRYAPPSPTRGEGDLVVFLQYRHTRRHVGAFPQSIVKHMIPLLPLWEKVPEGRMRGPGGIRHVMSLRPTPSHWRPSHQQPCFTPSVEDPLIWRYAPPSPTRGEGSRRSSRRHRQAPDPLLPLREKVPEGRMRGTGPSNGRERMVSPTAGF